MNIHDPRPDETLPAGNQSSADDEGLRPFGFDLSSDQWMNRLGQALNDPAPGSSSDLLAHDHVPGQHIGPYELLEPIGSGGMGSVWRARRADKQPDRIVALKLIRHGLFSRSAARRFRLEEQVLARLTHPNIARLYDGGISASGQPFLVMEYVEGKPIVAHAERQRLPLRDRLSLFCKVCAAVQYAHGALVLHRDLKPANILVDAEGSPRLLDFGIARLLDEDGGAVSLTATDTRVLTPLYASPEQVRGDVLTTASDVYSLGVILYELLTGRSPYALDSISRAEVERAVLDHTLERPSAAFSRGSPGPVDLLPFTAAQLRGDVDTIVMTALQKDPARRYASVELLAGDIHRYLQGLPISAAPDSMMYRASRFVRRNRSLVASAMTAAVALLAATAVATRSAVREARARAVAERQARELEQVVSFQAAQLSDIEPDVMGADLKRTILAKHRAARERAGERADSEEGPPDVLEHSLREINFTDVARETLEEHVFERAMSAIDQQFAAEPSLRAVLLQAVATTLFDIGLLSRAEAAQEEALQIRVETLGVEHADTLASRISMGDLLRAQGRFAEAERHHREALDICRRSMGDSHPMTLTAIEGMGLLLKAQGKFSEAEVLLHEALTARRQVLGDDHPDTLRSIQGMGNLLLTQGRPADAEPYLREALGRQGRWLGEDHPETLGSLNDLAAALKEQGRLAEAEPYYRDAVDRHRRVLGDEHPDTLRTTANLGSLLAAQGELTEAEPYYREVLEGTRRALGPDHPHTLLAINNMGHLLQLQQKPSEAEPFCREAMEGARRVFGEEHPNTLTTINNMGSLLRSLGRFSEAELYFRECLEARRRVLGDDHFHTLLSISNLGGVLCSLERFEEAEALGAEAVHRTRDALPAGHWALGEHLSQHASTLALMGRSAEAEAEMHEAYEVFLEAYGAGHQRTNAAIRAVVKLYEEWHAADPGKGHDVRAAEWRGKLQP